MQKSKEINLRPIEEGDYNVILEWHREHLKINFPSQKFNRLLFSNDFKSAFGNAFMMVKGTQRLGVISFDVVFNKYEDKNEGRIRYLHLDKSQRGQGLAIYLMDFAEKELKKQGAQFITLGTHVENYIAMGLYNEMGYQAYRITYRKNL